MRQEQDADSVLRSEEGIVLGFRVVYEQLPHNWDAYSPDLPGVIATGIDHADAERNMREAIPFHLEGMARDRNERPWLYEGEILSPQIRAALEQTGVA
jgi:predicted RNase H-like HicB family nuclease